MMGTRPWSRRVRLGALASLAAVALVAAPLGAEDVRPGGVVRLSAAPSDAESIRTLDLELGKSLFVRTDFRTTRVSVGDPGILDITVLAPTELQLVPKKIGSTNVVLWSGSGEPARLLDVNVGSSFRPIESRIRSVLGVEGVRVESAGEAVVLTGSVPSPVHVERALAVARAFFPEKAEARVVNALEVGGNQQVMIEVIIAEMQRSLSRNMSVNWGTIVQTGGSFFALDSFLGGLTAIDQRTTSLNPANILTELEFTDRIDLAGTFIDEGDFLLDMFVEAAQERGLAKVLAKPTLLARSGQTASFLAGGEIPIPVAQGGAFGSITIEFKEFGVGVLFAPTVLGPDRIHLEVSPEVSEPDFTIGTISGGFVTPGFVTRRASTSVELADGQSFAIAGLLQDNVREAVEKYPLLGDIPVLGALFRSVRFQRNETELVLIVTPHLVEPMAPGDIRLPTDSFVPPDDFEFYLLGALEAQREGAAPDEDAAGLIGPSGHRVDGDLEEETW